MIAMILRVHLLFHKIPLNPDTNHMVKQPILMLTITMKFPCACLLLNLLNSSGISNIPKHPNQPKNFEFPQWQFGKKDCKMFFSKSMVKEMALAALQ